MDTMINPVVEITQESVKELMAKLEAATRDKAVIRGMKDGAVNMQGWMTRNRLRGPRPQFLGRKTGLLSQSIYVGDIIKNGDGYRGSIGIAKTKASIYGPVHEHGFTGVVNVRSFVRKTGKIAMYPGLGKAKFQNIGTTLGMVKAHSRKMNIPARPFMKPTAENEDNVNYLVYSVSKNLSDEIRKAHA